MIRVRFILKNGWDIPVVCKNYTITTSNLTGELTNYSLTGVEGRHPIFIRFNEIVAIINEGEVADNG